MPSSSTPTRPRSREKSAIVNPLCFHSSSTRRAYFSGWVVRRRGLIRGFATAAYEAWHERAHRLGGVFTDREGPRIVVLQEVGRYGTYDVDAAGEARPAKDVQWETPHVEDLPSWKGFAPRCDDL